MAIDPDNFVLDRVFQPVADRQAEWATCFGLARSCVGVAVLLHLVVLCSDLQSMDDMPSRMFATLVTALAFFGADQTIRLIRRAERAARPGLLNIHRITLHWQRLAWLLVFACVMMTAQPTVASLAGLAATGFWLGAIYFTSCSPRPPAVRRARSFAHAPALHRG